MEINKKLNKSSLFFREIIETYPKKNKELFVLFTRALIRYSVRFFKLNLAKILLEQYLNVYQIFFLKESYEKYLLKINLFRIECRLLFANKKLNKYIKKRIEWANFILNSSLSKYEKKAASQYLRIIQSRSYYYKKSALYRSIKYKKIQIYKKKSKKKFYLYGPNSLSAPNLKYSNCILILTKMIDYDISNFKEKILFLNSYTSNQLTQEDKKLLLNKYSKIYISPNDNKIESLFHKFNIGVAGHIASPMALGRILNFLNRRYLNSEFIIEGFDFYLSKKSYSGHVKTALPLNNIQLSEHLVCQSLFDHEPLFNFLYVKNIISKHRVKSSLKFRKFLNLSGDQYLKKLFKFRDFQSLNS